jgi:hypothetical protein
LLHERSCQEDGLQTRREYLQATCLIKDKYLKYVWNVRLNIKTNKQNPVRKRAKGVKRFSASLGKCDEKCSERS